MGQLSMFDDEVAAPGLPGTDPDRVRRKLDAMLAEACSAGSLGLPLSRRRLIETVVPQMVRWLPDEEAQRVRQQFEAALAA